MSLKEDDCEVRDRVGPIVAKKTVQEKETTMRKNLLCAIFIAPLVIAPLLAAKAAKENEPVKRLDEAAAVFSEIMSTPDKSIPQDLLDKSQCIVIVPGMKKGAFIV